MQGKWFRNTSFVILLVLLVLVVNGRGITTGATVVSPEQEQLPAQTVPLPVTEVPAAAVAEAGTKVPVSPAAQPITPQVQPKPDPEVKLVEPQVKDAAVTEAVYGNYQVIRRGSTDKKLVALTFDDGPDGRYTGQVLDILKENQVKATFFVIGRQLKRYPDMVKRMVEEGHVVGNHTWNHVNLRTANAKILQEELKTTNAMLRDSFGIETNLIRPPFGSTSNAANSMLNKLGMHVVLWSVDTRDWAGTPTEKIMATVRRDIKPGGIILLHSAGGQNNNLQNTLEALPLMIAELKAQGYSFVTVPELLK